MPGPYMLQRGVGDQILALILLAQQSYESLKPLHRSTWNIETGLRLGFVHQAALRRAWTRIAAKAAGVIPRMRPAAPSVAGRDVESRSTISLERPGIEA